MRSETLLYNCHYGVLDAGSCTYSTGMPSCSVSSMTLPVNVETSTEMAAAPLAILTKASNFFNHQPMHPCEIGEFAQAKRQKNDP